MATAPHPISEEEYREIFGSSDEENSNESDGESSMESDIDFEGLASQSESESDEGSSNESDDETSWSQDFEDLVINNFASTSGIKVAVPNEANEKFFFNLIFDLSIINLVVRETNRYARKKLANTRIRLDKWQDVTAQELCAYFGMCIIMGINSLPRISMYWSSDSFIGNSGIQNVMTKNRFEEISQYIHFNDSSQEPPRGADNYDRLFKVRPILDNILEKIQNVFEPSKNLSIDEGMIAFKGRLSFRQYMPAKPTKYGIKVWMAADSSNGYVSNFSVYLGQEGNEHRIHGLGYDVVMKMATPFLNKNRHIFFDNFFSSSFLFDCLLAQNTYACGTVRCNRKDLPPCAKQKLKQGEIVTAQRGALVFTKWHDKRDISFLSTNVSPSEPSRPVQRKKKGQNIEIQKPRVADVYTAFMGGVDRADQLRSFYYTGWQSRKWYRYIFWFLFNLSICNAFVLFNIHRGERRKKPLLDFRLELAKQLIGGFSQRKRKRRSLDVPSETAVDPGQHISVHVEGRKRKCVACIKAGRRTPKGYKVETRFECKLCKVALCPTCHNEFHMQAE